MCAETRGRQRRRTRFLDQLLQIILRPRVDQGTPLPRRFDINEALRGEPTPLLDALVGARRLRECHISPPNKVQEPGTLLGRNVRGELLLRPAKLLPLNDRDGLQGGAFGKVTIPAKQRPERGVRRKRTSKYRVSTHQVVVADVQLFDGIAAEQGRRKGAATDIFHVAVDQPELTKRAAVRRQQ